MNRTPPPDRNIANLHYSLRRHFVDEFHCRHVPGLKPGSRVLDGVRIGQGAVVGANSVVRGDLAPYEIVVGAPARSIGSRLKLRDS